MIGNVLILTIAGAVSFTLINNGDDCCRGQPFEARGNRAGQHVTERRQELDRGDGTDSQARLDDTARRTEKRRPWSRASEAI